MRSLLDPGQIIKDAYDEASQSLRVKTNVAVSMDGTQEIVIDDAHDSIKVGDGNGHYVNVNGDGSINVNVISTQVGNITSSVSYNEVTNVASGFETPISMFTFVAGARNYLQLVDVSGTNLGEFRLYLNGSIIDKKYTTFNNYNSMFDYRTNDQAFPGLPLNSGDVVSIRVVASSSGGNYNSRIQIILAS